MSAISKVLDRLHGIKPTAPDRWMARCPAHEDRTPSLSVRGLEDGRVLLHCFSGCANGDVLAAMGLRMSDLFDKPLSHHLPPVRGGFNARELLELTAHEALVAAMLSTKAGDGGLTEEEAKRLRTAAARLTKAQALVDGR